ncbi:MerR family transcriptional regulator [Shewanella dokdonensis]|uniref:MerR family transcriptional regulator n=1 Tax=Shewanella dokdonensis TaxID=712036 RepID=A0ABX8DFF4_9GAMM|nr:MerR family transcriptional regulator [Shewanella dokdonensis]MCL1073772.1 MerR family transcriptional regulator [Shewanella dokdonensis]QVK22522.1 MerR family transcriptional regulator [Shewanella dokdonensis]
MPTDEMSYLSIGEVARRTGVNPITLRAWQRRFGLVVPARTPKGHRLYSEAQVQQIVEIRHWLERGVAISKVKPLLEGSAYAEAAPVAEVDSDWAKLAQALTQATLQLQAAALQQRLDEASSLYPQAVLLQHLEQWLSLLRQQLAARIDGQLLSSWLHHQLQQWLWWRAAKLLTQKAPSVLLCQLGGQPQWSEWLLTLSLVLGGYYPHVLGEIVNVETLQLLGERQPFCAVLLLPAASSSAKTVAQLNQLAQEIACPLLLGGEFAPLVSTSSAVFHLLQADDDVCTVLQQLSGVSHG